MKIKKISAEEINRNREKWHLTRSKKQAESNAGRRTIYRLPNGTYAYRKKRALVSNTRTFDGQRFDLLTVSKRKSDVLQSAKKQRSIQYSGRNGYNVRVVQVKGTAGGTFWAAYYRRK